MVRDEESVIKFHARQDAARVICGAQTPGKAKGLGSQICQIVHSFVIFKFNLAVLGDSEGAERFGMFLYVE